MSIVTFDSVHGPRQPPTVRCTRLRHLRRSHSRSYRSVGTAAWPRSVWPQQQPVAHTNRCPWRRGTLTILPSVRSTMLRRTGGCSVTSDSGTRLLGDDLNRHVDQRCAGGVVSDPVHWPAASACTFGGLRPDTHDARVSECPVSCVQQIRHLVD